MKVLLDTHAFLWLVAADPALSRLAKKTFEDEANELFLSLASVWEIAIKTSLKKLTLTKPVNIFLAEHLGANDVASLEISFRHACRTSTLPFHHRDPFDRLLAAQCLEESMPILSSDPAFDRYGVKRIW